MPRIATNKVALGVGVSGAMVDVSSYVDFGSGVEYEFGRDDSFGRAAAGRLSFTLDNYDGRFTPGNVAYGSVQRTNLMTNPGFEAGLTGVVALGATTTIDATVFQSGAQSLKVVTPGSAGAEGAQIGTTAPMSTGPVYSSGVMVLAPAAQPMNLFFRYNGLATGQGTTAFTGTGAWQFVAFNGLPSTGITITSSQILVRTANTAAITFWVDSTITEQAPTAGTPFDGSSASDSNFKYAWTGTVNASTSTQSFQPWSLTEGMPVCWQLGTRLVSGAILSISPVFPDDNAAWSQIQVTCDDMLGNAARTDLSLLADDINTAAGQYAMWRMDEDENAVYAREATGCGLGNLSVSTTLGIPATNPVVTFDQAPIPGIGAGQLLLAATAEINYLETYTVSTLNIPYTTNSLGVWGAWVTPSTNGLLTLRVSPNILGYMLFEMTVFSTGANVVLNGGGSISYAPTSMTAWQDPHYFAVGFTLSGITLTATFYVDGVSVGTATDTSTAFTLATKQPRAVRVAVGDGSSAIRTVMSRLSHTASLAHEEYVLPTTEANRLRAVGASIPPLVLDTLPADLSLDALGESDVGGSGLDALNEVVTAEQGHIWSATSGTLLAPVQKVKVRARNRPVTVSQSFDVDRELSGAPSFVRDITNMLASVDVAGPDQSLTVVDSAVSSRAGSASGRESLLFEYKSGLEAWGQDRLRRGKNVNLRVASVVVDALTTPTDRSSDVMSLVLGDRVRITGLPSTQLGYTTWDGWLIGGSEKHSLTESSFQLFFEPVLPDPIPVFDTARFGSGGDLYVVSTATAGATSLTVNTNGTGTPSTSVPYTVTVDSEQMTVTAVTFPGPNWTLTVTRGVNGTTAASHAANALIEMAVVPVFAF